MLPFLRSPLIMAGMRSLVERKQPKEERERRVLLSLTELYIESGKPVSSQTLQQNGLASLSSATIRNYFAKLEEEGFLKQHHSSGGRYPTSAAFQLYAHHCALLPSSFEEEQKKKIEAQLCRETEALGNYLQSIVEIVSEHSKCATFLSAPRFHQGNILHIQLVSIDQNRLLSIVKTDLGTIHIEILYAEKKIDSQNLKKIEDFFLWKLNQGNLPILSEEEEQLATRLYSETMLRYLINHTQFSVEEMYKSGFSKLLSYTDFNEASALADGLSLFENQELVRSLLKESGQNGKLSYWIGGRLEGCAVLAIPYKIHQSIVGSIALLAPIRINYRKLFALLETVAATVSDSLTRSLYKFKISFKSSGALSIAGLLLENNKKTKSSLRDKELN